MLRRFQWIGGILGTRRHRMDGIATDVKNVEEHKGLESLTQSRRTHKTGNRPKTCLCHSSRVMRNTPGRTRITAGGGRSHGFDSRKVRLALRG